MQIKGPFSIVHEYKFRLPVLFIFKFWDKHISQIFKNKKEKLMIYLLMMVFMFRKCDISWGTFLEIIFETRMMNNILYQYS